MALTFDDGPDGQWTPGVLDALANVGAKATFFVIAERATRHPGLIDRMLSDGHSVQLHCYAHERHTDHDRDWIDADTTRALDALSTMGVHPERWRTPWGVTTGDSERVAAEHGLSLIRWTADTHDWRGDPAEQMLANVSEEFVPGAVILCHDGLGPGALRTGCRETVRFVHLAADAARCRGFALGTIEDRVMA